MRKLMIVQPLLLSLLSLILTSFIPTFAEANFIVKQYWIEDANRALTSQQALKIFRQGGGKALEDKVFRLGNTKRTLWIYQQIDNQTPEMQSLRLLTGVPYSKRLRADLIRPHQNAASATQHAAFQTIINEHENRAYRERSNPFRLLNSNPFRLESGEKSELLIQTVIEGPSYLPISILTEAEFNQWQLTDLVFGALFYGFTATLGVLFLLFSIAVKHRVAILYAVLFLTGLLIIADIDGYAFKWLWPNSPAWNHLSPLVILPLLNGLGFILIHLLLSSVDSKRFKVLKPIAISLAVLSVVLPLFAWIIPPSTILQVENLLSIPAFILQPIAFISWLHMGRRSYFSLVSVLLIGLVVTILVGSVFLDVRLPDLILEHLHHFAYLIVGVLVMGIITVQLMGLHKDQQATLRRELILAQENAQINQSLLTAEQNYSRAQRIASRHQQQLASASHDLRQPVVSLRANIDAITTHQTPDVREQLKDAFDYLESLCSQYLQTSPTPQSTTEPAKEHYPVSLILNTVQRMFANEASQAGVSLRTVDCSMTLLQDPMVLMRIVSNLVANAIKHHRGGANAKVLLGCRRKPEALQLIVCDNGPGIDPEELAALKQPYQKGADSEGEGLGLAIIYQLAKENGLVIDCQSTPGHGTCFTVTAPNDAFNLIASHS